MHAILTADDVTTGALNRHINLNKVRVTDRCSLRNFSNTSSYSAHGIEPAGITCRNTHVQSTGTQRASFDHLRMTCLSEVNKLAQIELRSNMHTKLADEYDVVIVELGIHHILKRCRQRNTTDAEDLMLALSAMARIASPTMTVMWKTVGASAASNTAQSTQTDPRLVPSAQTKQHVCVRLE